MPVESKVTLALPEGKVTSKNDEPAGLDFLDFLFTVAMSVGLTPELLQVHGISGLLSEAWQQQGRFPTFDEWFGIGVFALGFLNLTLSWFGYHASIRSRPLKYHSGYGMARFIFDVSLVISYGVILIKYGSFGTVLVVLTLVYFVFVLWDLLKIGEYWKPPASEDKPEKYFSVKLNEARKGDKLWRAYLKAFRREWVTVVCFVFFVIFIFLYHLDLNRWIVLMGALFTTLFYRFNKNHLTWERLVGVRDV